MNEGGVGSRVWRKESGTNLAGDGVAERVAGTTHECSLFCRQNPTRKNGRGGGGGEAL